MKSKTFLHRISCKEAPEKLSVQYLSYLQGDLIQIKAQKDELKPLKKDHLKEFFCMVMEC